jgi:hypothetical protein
VPAGRSNATVHPVIVLAVLLVTVNRASYPPAQVEVRANAAVAADAGGAAQISAAAATASAVKVAAVSRVARRRAVAWRAAVWRMVGASSRWGAGVRRCRVAGWSNY